MSRLQPPEDHEVLADEEQGPYDPPGGGFHRIRVVISKSPQETFRVAIREKWGSNQGCEEEHGRNIVGANGKVLSEAISDAKQRALEAEMDEPILVKAMWAAEDAANS